MVGSSPKALLATVFHADRALRARSTSWPVTALEFAEITDTTPAGWGIAGAKAIAAQTMQRLPVGTSHADSCSLSHFRTSRCSGATAMP